MIFYLSILFNIILCSFFLFPIGFVILPAGVNTKIIMAAIGILFIYRNIKNTLDIPNYMLWLFVGGALFSCIGLFSVFYNETSDYAYASYLVSMAVWLSAAYVFVLNLGRVHRLITFRLIVEYLVAVCLLQCFLALFIEFFLPFKVLIDSNIRLVAVDMTVINEIDRLYGIGAALDPAGVRFSVVLVLLAVVLNNEERLSSKVLSVYVLSFLLIVGIGNLISRTTIVGTVLAMGYLICSTVLSTQHKGNRLLRIFNTYFIASIIVFILGYLAYSNMNEMRELIRYGFEAFFSLIEKGELTTGSTDKLNTMWVFPDNLKTWIIGDGWFYDPFGRGFYMFTDIGYLRFIFYCGVLGLLVFSLFLFYVVKVLADLYPRYRMAFYLLLLLGFIIWIKVSTDLFQFYALFIAMALHSTQKQEQKTV